MKNYKQKHCLEKLAENTHSVNLVRLQNIIIESFCICVFSINLVKEFPGSKNAGNDNISFKTVTFFEDKFLITILPKKKRNHTKFRSMKNLVITKKLISEHLKTKFVQEAKAYNLNLCLKIIPNCIIKTIMTNYKASSIKRI
jgi:hypothetical protein